MLTIRWLLCRFSRVGQVVLCGDFYQVFLTLGLILTRFSLFFGDRFSIPTRTPAVHRAACLLRDLQSQPSLTLSYHSAFPRLPSLLTRPLSPPLSPLHPLIALRSPLFALRSPLSALRSTILICTQLPPVRVGQNGCCFGFEARCWSSVAPGVRDRGCAVPVTVRCDYAVQRVAVLRGVTVLVLGRPAV